MAISQLHLIPRRVAYSAGHSLIHWASGPAAETDRARTIARETALRRHRARRDVELEQQRALNVNAFAWLRL
ncbi:hypothetical protein [Pseudactinotalea sp. Z1748]|uniref:hypothetical protein n=1 Tax=Pseudactinotalea sp. Z1748 TaxID=3413027 RepID=UPI003C7CA2F2